VLRTACLPASLFSLLLVVYEQSGNPPGIGSLVAPSNPSPANGGAGLSLTSTLSWSASDGATSYDVYAGTSSQLSLKATIDRSRYVFGPLRPGAKYYWKVVAKNGVDSKSSPTWSFTTAGSGKLSCDLNSDGVVDVVDVRIAENQALGVEPCGSADLNQDGVCTVEDVQRVVDAVLGKGCRIGR
jgi:hypothetical protein